MRAGTMADVVFCWIRIYEWEAPILTWIGGNTARIYCKMFRAWPSKFVNPPCTNITLQLVKYQTNTDTGSIQKNLEHTKPYNKSLTIVSSAYLCCQ